MRDKILIFDSGVGARAVDMALRTRLAQAQTVLVEDAEGFPYGGRSDSWVGARVQEKLGQAIVTHNPSHVVVASDTASFAAGPNLQSSVTQPLYLTFPPLAEAVRLTANRSIGVLVTPLTAKHAAFQRRVQHIQAAGIGVKVIASADIASMAENLIQHKTLPDLSLLKAVLAPFNQTTLPDVIILGCTHCGFLARYIQQALGREVLFLDSAEVIAQRIAQDIGLAAKIRAT